MASSRARRKSKGGTVLAVESRPHGAQLREGEGSRRHRQSPTTSTIPAYIDSTTTNSPQRIETAVQRLGRPRIPNQGCDGAHQEAVKEVREGGSKVWVVSRARRWRRRRTLGTHGRDWWTRRQGGVRGVREIHVSSVEW